MTGTTIPLLVDAPTVRGFGALPGEDLLSDAGTTVVAVASEVITAGVKALVQEVAAMLAAADTSGTGWEVKEAKVSLGIDANGQVSLWALKGQVGAKASLDITLRR